MWPVNPLCSYLFSRRRAGFADTAVPADATGSGLDAHARRWHSRARAKLVEKTVNIRLMANLWTYIFTTIKGKMVAKDHFGNRYYHERQTPAGRRRRRWVVYKGEAEASRVPPEWHAWLHHTTADAPLGGGVPRRPWQKPHQPNLTGTAAAYRPPGHLLTGGHRDRATGDYEPWIPD